MKQVNASNEPRECGQPGYESRYDFVSRLPDSLTRASGKGQPISLHWITGLLNREDRKRALRWMRGNNKKHGVKMDNLSDDELLIAPFVKQAQRWLFFWKADKNFKKTLQHPQFPFQSFGFSLLHSLLARYRNDLFASCRPLTDDEIGVLEADGVPIEALVVALEEGRIGRDAASEDFDYRAYSSYVNVWHEFKNDFLNWDALPDEQRLLLSEAVFALASSLDAPCLMDLAVERCPSLGPYYVSMEMSETEDCPDEPVEIPGRTIDHGSSASPVIHGGGSETSMPGVEGSISSWRASPSLQAGAIHNEALAKLAKSIQERADAGPICSSEFESLIGELSTFKDLKTAALIVASGIYDVQSPDPVLINGIGRIVDKLKALPSGCETLPLLVKLYTAAFHLLKADEPSGSFHSLRTELDACLAKWNARVFTSCATRIDADYLLFSGQDGTYNTGADAFVEANAAYQAKVEEVQFASSQLQSLPLFERAPARQVLNDLEAERNRLMEELIQAGNALLEALYPFEKNEDEASRIISLWDAYMARHQDAVERFHDYCAQPRPVPVADYIETFISNTPRADSAGQADGQASPPTTVDVGDEGSDQPASQEESIPAEPAVTVSEAQHIHVEPFETAMPPEPVLLAEQTRPEMPVEPAADKAESPQTEHDAKSVETDALGVSALRHELAPGTIAEVNDAREASLRDVFWSLVLDGLYGIARQLSQASPRSGIPECTLMDFVVYGQGLIYPHGQMARSLEQVVGNFNLAKCLVGIPEQDHHACNLLVVSSVIRSGLISPGSGAASLLTRDLSLGPGWETLHAIAQRIAHDAPQMHGVILGPDSLRKQQAIKDIAQRRAMLADEVRNWLEDNAHSKMPYQAATSVWHRWVTATDGVVCRLLKPVSEMTQGLPNKAEWKELIDFLTDPDQVEAHVQETDKLLRGARFGSTSRFGNIDYAALNSIRRRCTEAANLALRWTELDAPRRLNDYSERLIGELDQFLEFHKQAVFAEIDRAGGSDGLSMRAAANCLRKAVESLYGLFNPNDSQNLTEKLPRLALNLDALRIPSYHLSDALELETPAVDMDAFGKPQSVEESIERLMGEGDFFSAEHLAELLAADHPLCLQPLERLAEARMALRTQHKRLELRIESNFRSGSLSDSEREQLVARMADIGQEIDVSKRADIVRNGLQEIEFALQSSSDARVKSIRDSSVPLHLPEDSVHAETLENLLNKGDLLAAEEYIDHLRRGVEPPSGSDQEVPGVEFQQFLRRVKSHLEHFPEELRDGKLPSSLAKVEFNPETQKSAVELLDAWDAVKRLGRSTKREIEPFQRLLTRIGFKLLDNTPLRNETSRDSSIEFMLSIEPIADRRICPIPEFGSDSKGRYRVICLFAKQGELESTDIPQPKPGSVLPTLILFMRPFSDEGREELYLLNKKNRYSWLVLDEVMLYHLALHPQGRLRAFFAAALPYTNSDPYKSTKSGIVPPEMFFGRTLEHDLIVNPRGKATVYGGRQLGKTALIKEIERQIHDPEAGHIVKWIDVLGAGVGRSLPPEHLFVLIIQELGPLNVTQTDWMKFKPGDHRQVTHLMGEIQAWIERRPDRRMLLLLDETDDFLREDAAKDYPVTRQLKRLMEKTDGAFKCVFVGLHNVLRSTFAPNNPLVHLGAVEIGPLYANGESSSAFELVRGPFAALGYKFDSDALIMRILAVANYYPVLINHFCGKLLARARQSSDTRFPRIITDGMVASVYEGTDLRGEIRYYFNMTLDLDPRYGLIANWLAAEHLSGRITASDGAPVKNMFEGVASLWPAGFRGITRIEFEALANELIGLGVLRSTREGGYTFRNPNVLHLLGSLEEVEDRMLSISDTQEIPPGFDRTTSRNPIKDTVRDSERSPLTISQEQELLDETNGIRIVFGTALNGLPEVFPAIERRQLGARVVAFKGKTLEDLENEIADIRSKAKQGANLLMVGEDKDWTLEWVALAKSQLGSRISSSSHVKVVFAADGRMLWGLLSSGHLKDLVPTDTLILAPWADAFLKTWLDDIQMPSDRTSREAVLRATDGRHGLLRFLGADLDASSKLVERCKTFEESMLSKDKARTILDGLGVVTDDAITGLNVLTAFSGEHQPIILEALRAELPDGPLGEDFFEWARLMHLAYPAGNDSWKVSPFVVALLEKVEEE